MANDGQSGAVLRREVCVGVLAGDSANRVERDRGIGGNCKNRTEVTAELVVRWRLAVVYHKGRKKFFDWKKGKKKESIFEIRCNLKQLLNDFGEYRVMRYGENLS